MELDIEGPDGRIIRSRRFERGRESFDGRLYRFRLRHDVPPSVEETEGVAVRDGTHVTVAIERPKRRVLELPAGLLFPIRQTLALGAPPPEPVEHLRLEPGLPEPVIHTRTRLATSDTRATTAASRRLASASDDRVTAEARARGAAALAGLGPVAARLPPASAVRVATSLGFRPGRGDAEPVMEAIAAEFDNGVELWRETMTEQVTLSWTLTELEILEPLACRTPKVGK